MTVYFAFIIPFIVSAFLYLVFKHKVVLWEILVPIVATVILVMIAKWICVASLTNDTEYFGGYVKEARYYDDWNEEVDCRHPVYKEVCKGEGKERKCEEVLDHYKHDYDVDYHPEYWEVNTTLGTWSITQDHYNRLVKKFQIKPIFKDLHRNYHDNDGDMYYVFWDNTDEKLEPVTMAHTYENRPQATNGVYHYADVDSFYIKAYRPFNYPEITNLYHQQVILGYNDPVAEQKLQVVNSRLGATKQVRVYLLVFKNLPREAGQIQQQYWANGNKNEIVVCVGINDKKEVTWAHVFSWTEQAVVPITLRHYIEQNPFNLSNYVDVIHKEIDTHWVRKQFTEFNYLEIYPTSTQTLWIFIIVICLNVGIAYWVVTNEFEDEAINDKR